MLEEIARLTGGRTLSFDQPGEVFRTGRITANGKRDLTRALLIAALLLWLADIAVRRLSLPWGKIAAALTGRLAARRGQGAGAAGADAWSRLKQRTRNAGEFYGGGKIKPQSRDERESRLAGSGSAGPGAAGESPDTSRADAVRAEFSRTDTGRAHAGGADSGRAASRHAESDLASANRAGFNQANSARPGPGAAGSNAAGPSDWESADSRAGAPNAGGADASGGAAGSAMERLLAAKRRGNVR